MTLVPSDRFGSLPVVHSHSTRTAAFWGKADIGSGIRSLVFWNIIAPRLVKRHGFLNAKKFNIGSDNETRESLKHSVAWVEKGFWHDPKDGFDYQSAAQKTSWPPTWHLTGINDSILGNPIDVKYFINETANSNAKFTLLSKQNGNLVDYDHIDILTHPKAANDHFVEIASWLNQQG